MTKIYVYGSEGCIIDQSHGYAHTLDRRIIALATEHGFVAEAAAEDPDGDNIAKYEAWREIADEAVDYLNYNAVGTRMYFEVEDNSLFLRADEPTEEEFDEMLSEVYGEIDVCGLKYDAAYALKSIDPIAYRCGFADFCSAAFDD